MAQVSLGDMAHSFMLRRQNVDLKSDLQRLSTEMTTGRASDLGRRFGGDYAPLAGIDASLSRLDGYQSAAREAQLFTGAMQTALETVETMASDLGPALLAAASSGSEVTVSSVASNARQQFETAISMYNTRLGDRALFAGVETGISPLVDAETIFAAMEAEIATSVSAGDVEMSLTAWFDDPAGFATVAYRGGTRLAPLSIAPGEEASIDVTATDPAIRGTLKALAMAALLDRGALSGQPQARADLAKRAGEGLLESQTDRAQLAARLGIVEGQIASAIQRNTAEQTGLGIARSDLVSVDQYETVSKLEAVQTQLEALYTITARMTRLNLVDFIR
jgi:flagellar hook-associated protein 3 FlgL